MTADVRRERSREVADKQAIASILSVVRCPKCREPLCYAAGAWACPHYHTSWDVDQVKNAVMRHLMAENNNRQKTTRPRFLLLSDVMEAAKTLTAKEKPKEIRKPSDVRPWHTCEDAFVGAVEIDKRAPKGQQLADEIKHAYMRTHATDDGRARFKSDVIAWLRKPGRMPYFAADWPLEELSRMQQIADAIGARRDFRSAIECVTIYFMRGEADKGED